MTIRQIIGCLLMVSPVVVPFVWGCKLVGLRIVLYSFATFAGIIGIVALGGYLVSG